MCKYKYYGLFDSSYSLLIYCLKFTNQINETYYFFCEGISENIRINFKHTFLQKIKIKNIKSNTLKNYISKIYWNKKLKYINNNLNIIPEYIFGQDHILGGNYFLSKYKFQLIEDGLINYSLVEKSIPFLKRVAFKILRINSIIPLGRESNVERIYLTGMAPIPTEIKDKVEIINLIDLWKSKTDEEKKKILSIFNFNISLIEELKGRDILLLTQPLSEDGVITEEEKYQIYKDITNEIDERRLVIKTHPREVTKYEDLFPNSLIIKNPFPSQLLSVLGIEFSQVITLFSTAVNDFITNDTKVIFYGTNFHKNVKENFGNITYNKQKKIIEIE